MINIFAPINNLGYGVHANNIIKALTEKGEETNLTTIGQVMSDPFFEPFWKKAADNMDKFNCKNPSVFIFHDEYSHSCSGSPNMVFSVFEGTKIKKKSKHMLENGPSDIVLVTTQKHKELLTPQITKPIEVVNEGVDDSVFNTIPVDAHINTGKFTFITVGKREERKNTDMILRIFIEKFKEASVALIAHTFNMFLHKIQDHPFKNLVCWSGINPINHGFEYKGFDGKAHKFTHKDCDIYFTAPTLQTAQMGSLYHSANVGIQISRAEGWDLPLTEMMGTGMPVIASECLGHIEYLPGTPEVQKALNVPILANEAAKDDHWFKEGEQGEWGKIEEGQLEEKIINVMDNQDKYAEKSDELADYMSENYSWSKAADKLVELSSK